MAQRNSWLSSRVREQIKPPADMLARSYIEQVQGMGLEALLHLQSVLGHGQERGVWDTPRTWFPGGCDAIWKARFEDRIKDLLPPDLRVLAREAVQPNPVLHHFINDAVLSCTRYLVLCRIGPVSLANGREALDPSVISQIAYRHAPILAATSIGKAYLSRQVHASRWQEPNSGDHLGACFYRLTADDINALAYEESQKVYLRTELTRMCAASARGLWCDAPQATVDITRTTRVAGAAISPSPERIPDPHQPLPDDYVGEMGQKSHWLISHLGPNIIRVLREFRRLWKDAALNRLDARTLADRCRVYLAAYEWVDADEKVIESLPMKLRLNMRGAHSKKTSKRARNRELELMDLEAIDETGDSPTSFFWPPRGAAHVFGLARALQGAHLFVGGLSTGARNAETLMLERSCVYRSPDGTPFANGRTYKLVRRHEGELRDWALPALAETAFEQQATLVSLMERLSPLAPRTGVIDPDTLPSGTGLWFSSLDRTKPATSAILKAALRHYADCLGFEAKPGGQWIRPHRLRKTLARMVALAIAQAPKVLQDVFGHKSIEMTLHYVLADESLAAEIDTIVHELRVVRCADILVPIVAAQDTRDVLQSASGGDRLIGERLVGDGHGGKAADSVRRAVSEYGRELHQRSEDWGADSIRELAQILTLGGSTWNLVRPGVVCTKSLGQAGPCIKNRGPADPGNCQGNCDYRLEEAWLRDDVDRCISDSLNHWQREIEDGQDLVAEFWAGQLRMHLVRFPELQSKWMQDQRVKSLIEPLERSGA